MLKVLFLLMFFPLVSSAQGKFTLGQNYNFLLGKERIERLQQSNDTLYQLTCFTNGLCLAKPANHYRILSSVSVVEFTVVKLEGLDSLYNNLAAYYPEKRYSIMVFKDAGQKQLSRMVLSSGLTKNEAKKYQISLDQLRAQFFFTYFSDEYLRELSKLKSISFKADAQTIVQADENEKSKFTSESRSLKNLRASIYAPALQAELLTKACIESGFNPVGAEKAIITLLKNND